VDVFKHFKVFENPIKKGKVTNQFSKDISRRTFQLKGRISASNYLLIDNQKNKNSYLLGRYIYIAM